MTLNRLLDLRVLLVGIAPIYAAFGDAEGSGPMLGRTDLIGLRGPF